MSVVGIDLGDENLTVAVARRAGIDVLQNHIGKRKTNSGVAYTRFQRFIGDEFPNQYLSNAANSVIFVKRLIGKMFNDPEVQHEQKFLPCQLVPDADGRVGIKVKHLNKEYVLTPEQVLATLLTKVKNICEDNSDGQKTRDCVIAVPSYFSDAQRRSVLDAANIAGLNALRLVNETTAIALQYGMGRPIPEPRTVLFYDMGVSSTDVALITISATGLKVEAVASDRLLGGRDIDECLTEFIAAQIQTKYKLDVKSNLKAWLRLRRECDRLKQILSANAKVPYNIEYLMNDVDVSGMVTRDELNAMLESKYKDRLLAPVKYVIEKSGIAVDRIHSIELLGGSTRVPYIQQLLKESCGVALAKTCDADESVCRGATLQCAMLSSSFKVKEYEVADVAPYGVIAEWLHDASATPTLPVTAFETNDNIALVKLYTNIPATRVLTIKDTQLPVKVAVKVENSGQPLFPTADPTIARFVISKDARATLPDTTRVKIRFKFDASGCCSVSEAFAVEEVEQEVEEQVPAPAAAPAATPAAEGEQMTDNPVPPATETVKTTKKVSVKTPLNVTAYYPFSLSSTALQAATELEREFDNADRIVRETAEAKNELEAYILNVRPRVQDMNDLGKYFSPEEATAFVEKLRAEEEWLDDDGYDETRDVYMKRLSELKAYGEEALMKHKEIDLRQDALHVLNDMIAKANNWVNTTDVNYSHIPNEERAKVTAKTQEILTTVTNAIAKQEAAPPTAPLVITASQIHGYAKEVEKFAMSIMNKPKPKPVPTPTPSPKPAETPKPAAEGEAKPAGEEGAAAEDKPASEEAPAAADAEKAEGEAAAAAEDKPATEEPAPAQE